MRVRELITRLEEIAAADGDLSVIVETELEYCNANDVVTTEHFGETVISIR